MNITDLLFGNGQQGSMAADSGYNSGMGGAMSGLSSLVSRMQGMQPGRMTGMGGGGASPLARAPKIGRAHV